ncbi:MAG: hypothetical protein M3121_01475 [Chloroflexota bacterium]|nr:hypothetical protein [Chloroflexota bacterium]
MTSAAIEIRLFGKFSVHRSGEPLSGLEAGKVQELFSYLLLHRDRAHSRDLLAGTFWGDHPTAQAKKYLRQALWQLQSLLKPAGGHKASPLLQVAADHVSVNADAGVWLDVAAFEEACARVEDLPDRGLGAEEARRLRDAVGLYRGELLDGCYQDWCLADRERLQGLYLAMLDKLMGYAEARQQYEAAVSYGTRILRYDPAREQTHQRLMVLHHLMGNRTEALRQYVRCTDALQQELDVEPARRTVELYEQIRDDRFEERPGGLGMAIPWSATLNLQPVPTTVAVQRLRTLMVELESGMARVERELRALELALEGPEGGPGRQPRSRNWRPLTERAASDLPRAASDA